MLHDIALLAAYSFVAVFGAMLLLWLVSLAIKDSSIVDMIWGPGLALVAWVGYVFGAGVPERKLLVAVLVTIWASRLAIYIIWRNWGAEDRRYARLRAHVEGQGKNFAWHSLTHIYLYQGLAMWVTSFTLQIAQTYQAPVDLGLLAYAGVALWAFGLLYESIADWQLAAFRRNPANAGKTMMSGLWRYSRHPNYFGEITVWIGLFLIACENWVGALTVFSPIFIAYNIIGPTGASIVERRMHKKRPDFAAYRERTNFIIPGPPRKALSASAGH
ncbi:MAG: DUF1295 domain-containing protein [Sphingomonadales bacterium]